VPWSIATHIAETYWQSSRHWGRARIVALVTALGQLLIALLLAPVLISLLGLTLLLGLLPIPQVRSLILLTQSTLTATVGDSLAFVESPVRAALIRECILEGQTRLKQLCKYTVIVAH
jgi:fumarate reductase subunit D